MQNPKLKWIFTMLTIIIMLVIFLMSSKPSIESREDSSFFSLRLVDIFTKDYDELEPWQQFRAGENLDELIRKLAHVAEFAGLAFFARLTLESWFGPSRKTPKSKRLTIQAILVGFLYACSDEIHQIFVPGRSCELRDILIDTTGVVLGVLVSLLILRIINNYYGKNISEAH